MKTPWRFRAGNVLGLVALAALFLSTGLAQEAPKKVTKAEGLNAVTTKVPPDYPPIARQLKIEGAVELEAVVTETGAVEKVNIVSGNPGIDEAGLRCDQKVEIRAVHQRR